MKSLKKQEKEAEINFVLLSWSRYMTRWFVKTHFHRPNKILQFLIPERIQKLLPKYFNFFNNTPSASWVAHITRDFIICHSRSYYSSMHSVNDLWIKSYQRKCIFFSKSKRLQIYINPTEIITLNNTGIQNNYGDTLIPIYVAHLRK